MSSHHDWLTQEELLQDLGRNGIELPERTFRFWVAQGVLDAPVKKPYRGADGRVGFYPRQVLELIPQVLQLQEEGWKLRQIRQRLSESRGVESRPAEPPKQVPAPSSSEQSDSLEMGQKWAERYLQDLLSDTESRDRRRCFSSTGSASSELRQVRHYLVARLERWVGRSVAVRATSAFLLNLSERDFRRLFSRLRVSTTVRLTQRATESETESAVTELPDQEERSRLLLLLNSRHEGLLRWQTHAQAPVLLGRTLSVLETLQNLMQSSETSPETLERLNHALADLSTLEAQAQADLEFLQQ